MAGIPPDNFLTGTSKIFLWVQPDPQNLVYLFS
jgi:hypothetical protein